MDRKTFETNCPLPIPEYAASTHLQVSANCMGCGLTLDMTAAFLVHLKACGHTYHQWCFHVLCSTRTLCLGDCGTEIPLAFLRPVFIKEGLKCELVPAPGPVPGTSQGSVQISGKIVYALNALFLMFVVCY